MKPASCLLQCIDNLYNIPDDTGNDSEYLDRLVWTNSVDTDHEQSDQGLHRVCLPFCLHLLDELLLVKPHYSNFRIVTAIFLGCQKTWILTVKVHFFIQILFCHLQ